MAADSRRHARQIAGPVVRVAGFLLTAGTLWWFLRGLNARALGHSLTQVASGPLVIALLLNFAGQFVRTVAWRVMLAPTHTNPLLRLLRYEYAAQAASSVSPAKTGEVLRFWLLRREGVPAVTTGGLIALKKLLGANALMLLVLPTPWLLSGLPGWVGWLVIAFSAAMAALLALTIVVARAQGGKLPGFLKGLLGGLYLLRDGRRTAAAAAVILVGETVDLLAAWVVLDALHIRVPVAAAGLLLFLIDLSNAMPAAPAQLGTFEVGAYYVLDLLHVPQAPAIAFALLFHAWQALPQIAVGLPFALRFLLGRRREERDRQPPDDVEQPTRGTSRSPV